MHPGYNHHRSWYFSSGKYTMGFSVAVMPDAYVGAMYDETATILVPKDTVIDTLGLQIPATIIDITITGLEGLPPSMSYQCDAANCFYLGDEHGCIKITGTPTSADMGFHLIKVWAYGSVNVPGLGTLSDSLFFLMSIDVKMGQSVDEDKLIRSVKVTPNPIRRYGVISFVANDVESYSFELLDVTGKVIRRTKGVSTNGTNEIRIDRNGLSEGLYFYSLQFSDFRHSGRLMVTD